MKVRYTPRALGDLAAISDYLAARNPLAGNSVRESIRTMAALLEEFPEGGRVLKRRRSVRVIPLTKYPYLIYYSVEANEIAILHVRHGARRPVKPNEL